MYNKLNTKVNYWENSWSTTLIHINQYNTDNQKLEKQASLSGLSITSFPPQSGP